MARVAKPAPRGWRRVLRWVKRLVLGALALVVLAIVAVLILVHTDWGRERIKNIAVAQLDGLLGGPAKIDRLDGSIFGELTATGIELDDEHGKPVIGIKSLRFAVDLWPLVSETVRIDHVIADGVEVNWRGLAPRKTTPDTGPSSWTIDLQSAEVTGAHVIVVRTGAPPIELDGVTVAQTAHALIAGGTITAEVETGASWKAGGLPGMTGGGTARVHATYASGATPAIVAQLDASLGDAPGAPVFAAASFDPRAMRLVGVAIGDGLGIASVRGGAGAAAFHLVLGDGPAPIATRATGDVVLFGAAIASELPVRGVVHATLEAGGKVKAGAVAAGNGGAHADLTARLAIGGGAIALTESHVHASAADPITASGGRAPLTGDVEVDAGATGTILPDTSIALSGAIDVARPATAGDVHARSLHADFDAPSLPAPTGTLHAHIDGIRRAALPLGDLELTVQPMDGGRLSVGLTSHPRGPWAIDADTIVTPGATTQIAIIDDKVQIGAKPWQGTGGTVAISATDVTAQGIRMASADGSLAVDDLHYGIDSGELRATASARGIDAGALARLVGQNGGRGALDAHAKVTLVGDRWTGSAAVDARKVALSPSGHPLDAHVEVALAPRGLTVHANGGGGPIGEAAIDADVTPPAAIADVAAWRRLGRGAVRTLHLRFDHFDVAAAERAADQHGANGVLDGDLVLGATAAHGLVHLRGGALEALPGTSALDADIALSEGARGALVASGMISIGGLAAVKGNATAVPPPHPFDPAAWRAAGVAAIGGAHLSVDDVTIDPELLAWIGVTAPLHGRLSADLQIEAALAAASLRVDARGVTGDILARAIDLHAQADLDRAGAKLAFDAHDGATLLATATATSPLAIADALAAPTRALAAPLTGGLAVPTGPLATWLALAGRSDASGTLGAQVALGGTVGAPTAIGAVQIADLRATGTPNGLPAPAIHTLVVKGSLDGRHLAIDALAEEDDGGQLHATAQGDVAQLASADLVLSAHGFDLAPLAVLAPGVAEGTTGVLDAQLQQHGLDPDAGALHGTVHLERASVPLSPLVGTLRDADLAATIDKAQVSLKVEARLGAGHLELDGKGALGKAAATHAEGTIQLHGVTTIGARQPAITGTVKATLKKDGGTWRADLDVQHGEVALPSHAKDELHPAGAPSDMVYGDARAPAAAAPPPAPPRRPSAPGLVVAVHLGSTQVTSDEVRATVTGHLNVSIGDDGIGYDGTIATKRADVDILGRRYLVDQGTATFDGTLDPLLDIDMSYKFPTLALYATVTGRASQPNIDLSGDPAIYTRDQLFSFLLGGEPGGDPSTETRDAASGAAAAVASSMVGNAVSSVVPGTGAIKPSYVPATASSSAAFTVRWWWHGVLVGLTRHIDPLPVIENNEEIDLEWWFGRDWVLHVVGGDEEVGNVDITHTWRR